MLHRLVSPIVLAIIYFLVITPYGLVMRLAHRDPLKLKLEKHMASYWVRREPPGPAPDSMSNQF